MFPGKDGQLAAGKLLGLIPSLILPPRPSVQAAERQGGRLRLLLKDVQDAALPPHSPHLQ